MNWSLFFISTALWILFFEHFAWVKKFEAMAELGMEVPAAFTSMSKTLSMITMFNLGIFLFVYGFKVSWIWSSIFVIGGYVSALAYVFLTRGLQGTLIHKIGFIGMPVLGVGIWIVAFAT